MPGFGSKLPLHHVSASHQCTDSETPQIRKLPRHLANFQDKGLCQKGSICKIHTIGLLTNVNGGGLCSIPGIGGLSNGLVFRYS